MKTGKTKRAASAESIPDEQIPYRVTIGGTPVEVTEVAVQLEPGDRLDLTGCEGTAQPRSDPVHRPAHYTSSPARCTCGRTIECIDVVRHLPFDRGNVIKYLWRAGSKPTASEIEDLEKALWYLKDELARVKGTWVEP